MELEKRYKGFLSRRTKDRKLVTFWEGDDLISDPDMIEMTGGMPNEQFFPLNSLELTVNNDLSGSGMEGGGDGFVKSRIDRYLVPEKLALAVSLQYSDTKGLACVVDLVREMVERVNKVKYDEWDVLFSSGSSDSMFKIFEVLCDSESTVLVEEFTFTPVISNIKATGAKIVPIKLKLDSADYVDQGIDVEYLEDLLESWGMTKESQNLARPKILYTIPTGQNPTGLTLSNEKRRKIYKIAQKYDLLIVEDDPYSFFTFPPFSNDKTTENVNPYTKELSVDDYVQDFLYDSFLSMDRDGRVIRLETFSKLYAPGIRLGFIVANNFFIKKFLEYTEITTKAPSGLSQSIFYATIQAMAKNYAETSHTTQLEENSLDLYNTLLVNSWLKWIMELSHEYLARRNFVCTKLYETTAYKENKIDVIVPSAGMFVCVKINFHKIHPSRTHSETLETTKQLSELDKALTANGVKVVLGNKLSVSNQFSKDKINMVRLSIAYPKNTDQLAKAIARIDTAIAQLSSHP